MDNTKQEPDEKLVSATATLNVQIMEENKVLREKVAELKGDIQILILQRDAARNYLKRDGTPYVNSAIAVLEDDD